MTTKRHSRRCVICNSENREAIELAYLDWKTPSEICRRFGIRSKNTIYLHAEAFDLSQKRDKNIKRALASLIEKNLGRKLTGAALVSAIATFAKIDADGRSAERIERTFEPGRFDGWTRAELEEFVMNGTLPARFKLADLISTAPC